MNLRGDVIWALRGQGGGLTVAEISNKIVASRKNKYSESKIMNVLDVLIQGGQVEKGEGTGRVLYAWKASS